MADKELDDEMDLLREIEGDGGGAPTKSNFAAKLKAATAKKKVQDLDSTSSVPILVQDSQTTQLDQQKPLPFPKLPPSPESIEMPLGPDRALDDESEEDSHTPVRGRDGKPLRVFKKRGQKRSTRMSKMRPSKAKWNPEPVWKLGSDETENDEGGGNADGIEEEKRVVVEVHVVEETQLSLPVPQAPAANADDDDDDMLKTDNEEFVDSCLPSASDEDEDPLSDSDSKIQNSNTSKKIYNNNAPDPPGTTTKIIVTAQSKKPEQKKSKRKKIAPTANPNFRALKIRGKGAAGGKRGKKYGKSQGRR